VKFELRRRLTFANVIAMIALFVSLGGGVYAASKINGKHLGRHSVPGNRLKPETINGKQVKESSLGTVPSAQSADHATNADLATSASDAATLGGSGPAGFVSSSDVRRIRFDVTTHSSSTSQPFFEMGPLELTARCNPSGYRLQLSTSAQSGGYDAGFVSDSSPTTVGGSVGAAPQDIFDDSFSVPSTHRYVGTIIYNDLTTTISIPFVAFISTNSEPTGTRCTFTGTAARTTG
jgi:hypothetical protein